MPTSSEERKPATDTTERESGRHPVLALREEMERLFDDFFTGWSMGSIRRRPFGANPWRRFQGMFESTFPTADLVEDEAAYRITAELPGISDKDVEISLAGDVLTLKGEKKEEREEKGQNRYLTERRFGSFQRSFALPEDADPEKIDAEFKNGVLTVILPKRPDAQAKQRRIEVRST